MTVDDLQALRAGLKATQSEMATQMGMPLRTYQDIEGGKNPVRPIHEVAAFGAAVLIYINKAGAVELPELYRQWILGASAVIEAMDKEKARRSEP